DNSPVLCPRCGHEVYGPFHEPSLGGLLHAMESGRQKPFAWEETLSPCCVDKLVWIVCGLSPETPLTAEAVSGLRARVRQQTWLTESEVDTLTVREAADLVNETPDEPRDALLGAWVRAQALWGISHKERPEAPLKVMIEEFAVAHRRLEASNLPVPWRR